MSAPKPATIFKTIPDCDLPYLSCEALILWESLSRPGAHFLAPGLSRKVEDQDLLELEATGVVIVDTSDVVLNWAEFLPCRTSTAGSSRQWRAWLDNTPDGKNKLQVLAHIRLELPQTSEIVAEWNEFLEPEFKRMVNWCLLHDPKKKVNSIDGETGGAE